MKRLTLDDFAGTEGTVYAAQVGEGEVPLVLESATELPPSPREGGTFRLFFRGPAEPLLKQATYPLRRDEDEFHVFLVPVSQDSDGTAYEAIFF